ncbi:hypothetical protein EIP91_006092 [Steccherinum ochraceum]|uniref:Uncharacterized protein n=1 Tax=Steccherinum ochraceum TaxID=92696 RepID=A0A4R0R652_9APHY|nr:hypothetical protein EIP91_006092 [Steccherinum ochraceum]
MPPRPASIASFDSAAAAEALDLFDEKNASFRTSKLAVAGAVFGSSPRRPGVVDQIQRSSPSHVSRLARRSTSEAYGRSSPSTSTPSTPSRLRSSSAAQPQPQRPGSPDIDAILAKTPRPRRASSAVFASPSRSSLPATRRSQSTLSLRSEVKKGNGEDDESIFSISDYGALLEEDESQSEGEGGSESDSSIDIHTPLPHLMFRDGLLSPRSKLLPHDMKPAAVYPFDKGIDDRARSVLSIASTAGSFTTKSGLQKDPRDTVRRRQRHRDGSLLRAGMGLTTGLGWSDSEDEDAPSALTRRLITTTLDRKRSASVALSSPSRPSSGYDDLGLSRFASPVPMSRFTSPVPSKQTLARKSSGPLVGMRSMSVSQIQLRTATVSFPSTPPSIDKRLPTTPEELPTTRRRAPSTSSASSKTKSPRAVPSNLPTTSSPRSPRQRTTSSASATASVTSSSGIAVPRSRADSAASTAPSIGPGLRSRTTSSASTTPSVYSRHRTESSTSSTGHSISIPSAPAQRPSLESVASESTTSLISTSSHTNSSQSSSTASGSSGSVPRPLRLLQSISARTQSQDQISLGSSSSLASQATSPQGYSPPYQRRRALSGPRPRPEVRSPTPTQQSPSVAHSFSGDSPSLPSATFKYPQLTDPVSPLSSSSTAYFSPVSPGDSDTSPTSGTSSRPTSPSSPRSRPALIGARPKPRTGTGMAYRTSSFGNLQAQASALRMRTLATGPTPVSMAATENGGGYPVRI